MVSEIRSHDSHLYKYLHYMHVFKCMYFCSALLFEYIRHVNEKHIRFILKRRRHVYLNVSRHACHHCIDWFKINQCRVQGFVSCVIKYHVNTDAFQARDFVQSNHTLHKIPIYISEVE